MGKFFSNIVSFFIQKPLVFLGVFGLVILILINGFTKVKLDEDIYSILPKSEQFKKFNNVIKENNLNKQVVFSVNSKNKDIDEVIETMNDLSSQLTSKTKGLIKGITVVREIDEMDVLNNFYANFPGTLSDKDYELINTIYDIKIFLNDYPFKQPNYQIYPTPQIITNDNEEIGFCNGSILFNNTHKQIYPCGGAKVGFIIDLEQIIRVLNIYIKPVVSQHLLDDMNSINNNTKITSL